MRGILKKGCFFVLLLVWLGSCQEEEGQQSMAEALAEMEETEEYQGSGENRKRIQEIKKQIQDLEQEYRKLMKNIREKGILYKMLALKYMDSGMFGPAEEALQEALQIYPENHLLHYYMAVCQGYLADAEPNQQARQKRLNQAERFYKQTVEQQGDFFKGYYGLAVLYAFETKSPSQALSQIEKALALRPDDVPALFLKGKLLAETGAIGEAVEIYDRLTRDARKESEKQRAEKIRQSLLEDLSRYD